MDLTGAGEPGERVVCSAREQAGAGDDPPPRSEGAGHDPLRGGAEEHDGGGAGAPHRPYGRGAASRPRNTGEGRA